MSCDSVCAYCKHWSYSRPDDMGVCTHLEGPKDPQGFVVSMKSAVMQKSTKKRYPDKLATSSDTQCKNWEPSW